MSNLTVIITLALQDGANVADYTSIFCPRVGEIIRPNYVYCDRHKEYKVLAVHHNVARSGEQFGVYVIVEDVT